MRRIKISLLLIFALATIVSCALWGREASADNQSPITYHNGPVMAGNSNAYVIWYGNWSASSGPNSLDTQIILINFLSEIGSSINMQINFTYPGVNGAPSGAVLYGGSEVSSYTHGTELDAAAIQGIVAENISPAHFLYDPKGIYIVVASSDVGSNATGFCTPNTPPLHGTFFHGGGQEVKYAFIGNPARCPSVAAPQFFAPNGSQLATPNGNLAADAMASAILHALDTTVTDPNHTAWFGDFGLENADKCQGSFSKTHTLGNGARVNFSSNGHNYLIQDNWVNNFGGYCGQQNDAPPRCDDQTVQVIQDTAKQITLTAVDDNGDAVNFSIVTPPQHGTLTGSGANRTYTPASNFHGADSFTFKANDGTLDSTVATVSINVNTNSALDGFDPNANGLVRVAVVQPDGKILIGGDFTTLAPNGRLPVTRNYIARLNTDGTLDPTFNPSANSSIQAIALQPDGKIILGGDFSAFAPNGGASISRNNIARFNADGTIDTTLNPRANGSVHAIAVQADGGIVIGGEFQGFNPGGGATVLRNYIARLSPNGALDTTFDPRANNAVETLAVQPDGRILMGGRFTTLAPNGGATVTRNYVARLNVDGTLDAAFNPNPDSILGGIAVQPDGKILIGGAFITLTPNGGSLIARNHLARLNTDGTVDVAFNPNVSGFVRLIILQPDGRILIGGGFNSLAPNGGLSVPRKYIARLNPDGTLDPGVNANPNDQVWAIAVQPDGKIVVGGVFFSSNSFRGQTRNRIARLEVDGRLDQTLNINSDGDNVYTTAVQPDGKILIGGDFVNVAGGFRVSLARLNSDGTLDDTLTPGINDWVRVIAVQADGKILIGGPFTGVALGNGTITRNYVARIKTDGSLDSFNPNLNNTLYAIAVQPDGKILLGGSFTALAPNGGPSVARGGLVRLHADGTLDTAFNPSPNDYVSTIALQADGKILVGGRFTEFTPNGGTNISRKMFARLNPDGTVDPAFDPNPNQRVMALTVQPDGKILAGGYFTAFAPFGGASVTRTNFARLNTDGTVDNAFSPNPDNGVLTIASQADGKILIGGLFHSVSPNGGASQPRESFARLNADGTVDPFDPQPNHPVFTLALQPDGKILVGGSFDNIGGQARRSFARLANDTAAIQNLAVTQTSVTWTRSGAETELSRVSFERSSDGINYTFLGNGTRIGTSSDFMLAGQNLPTQQNLYIRARGFYRGGENDASESITESVRNVFLPQALHLAFAQQPTNTPENGAITPPVTVQILDAANNLINSTAAVTIGIGTNPSSGTLAGTKTVSAVGGTATFNNLAIDKLGAGYTLNASGTNLTGAVSNQFNITVNTPANIVATAGSGQSAIINSTFTTALQVKVTDINHNPVSGVVVSFNAPANGASGTFANNTSNTTATTDANGVATAASFSANGTAGLYSVPASINGGSTSTAFNLTNAKANQTIIVTTHAPSGATFNTQFSVAAASSTGLPVSYSSSGGCTNIGATFTMNTGTGTCTVNYTQAGDANHHAAQPTTETVTAQKAAQTITFDAIADKVFGDSDLVVNASASSGLSPNLAASGKCTANGSTVHLTGAGSCTITGSQPGNSAYDAAPDIVRSFNIAKASSTTLVTVGDAIYDGSTHGGSATATGAGGLTKNLTVSYTGRNGTSFSSTSAPTTAGDYTASATYNGDANHNGSSDSKNFTIATASQTIDFNAIANKTFGDPDFAVNALSSSGLLVGFATSGQCTISGLNVHITGAGVCTITASQLGDANYHAATEAQRSFQIAKAGQTISFDAIANKTFGDPDFAVGASATSGLSINFAASGNCTTIGTAVHITGAGPCTVTASQLGDVNYNPANEVQRSFQIAKAGQTISFDAIANKTFGDPDFAVGASATSGLSINFAASGNCTTIGTAVHITGAGPCTVTASQLGDVNYNPANEVQRSFQIAKAGQTISFDAIANKTFGDPDFAVGASATSGLSINFAASGNCTTIGTAVHITGAGPCTVTASQLGDANYNPATEVQRSFQIAKAGQTISFDAIANKTFGDPDFAVGASATSGLSINFAASGNCTTIGTTVHITGAGPCTVTASQLGDANYHAATEVQRSFQIAKAGQTITFDAIANKTFGDPDFAVGASATSGRSVTFATSGQCANSGPLVHISGAGNCTVTASEGGDANYNAATEVQRSFQIAKGGQTISFDAIADKAFGDPDFQIGASATSGRPVSFATSGQCANSGSNLHISGAGSCTVTASEGGDANYNAATEVQRSFQIAKAGQTITFDVIADKTFGDPDFQISASATSGRTVSFATSGQCANSGSNLHISGAGSCTVTASESGDANYIAAPDVARSFQISKASTTTGLSSSANPSVGQSVTFTATVTSGVGVPKGTATFKYDGAAITSCGDVTLQSGSASCVTSALSGGPHTITAEYSGEANFEPSAATLITETLAGSVFEFSQASYGVAERGGFVTITVQRTGDLAAPASVDYATDDGSIPSVAVGCSLVTGTALERCDYTRAAGTLQFAANETEKSFVVLVNDDSYVEGTESTSLILSNPGGGAALGPRATATLQIMDDLAESFGNPVDDGATFVSQHYHDFLNREPDSEGLQFWTKNLALCDTDGCAEVKRIDTSAAFFLSIEFQETGYLVERFYKVAYGDATGASTFGGQHQLSVPVIRWREFLHDTQEIGNRVIVGQAAWQEQLEDQKQAFAREFISRERFTFRYPASLSAEQFVNQLNANTGGVITSAEIMQLEEIFGGPGATSGDAAKRAQVLRTIAESQALRQKEFNRAFVLMQYFGYLRRNPDDAQDTDYTGYDFWLQKLEGFGGNYVNAEMVKAFVSSIEYRQRFGQ